MKKVAVGMGSAVVGVLVVMLLAGCVADRASKRQAEMDSLQKEFSWWPTDAKPSPMKDVDRGGYWWWPNEPGSMEPWGNRGYCYVAKIIFDYKAEELPPAKPQEMRPSLLIKKIIKNEFSDSFRNLSFRERKNAFHYKIRS